MCVCSNVFTNVFGGRETGTHSEERKGRERVRKGA